MTALVDTHCHLDPQYYPDGHEAALDRARQAGVRAFVTIGVGETLDAARHAVTVAGAHADVWASVGLHPHDAQHGDDAYLTELASIAASPRVVAFGEIGLDYHYMHSPREKQLEVFAALVEIAVSQKLPIVVHTREAAADTLRILEESRAREVGGIIHCFSEDVAFARRALDVGFDLSFSGIVTFKNAKSVQETAVFAPADRILVETDSPYLAPIPFRGKPCEPAHVVYTARRIAELRGVTFEEIAAVTTENARRRLGLEFGAAARA
jgi:TatD DNase family protein